MMEASSLSIEEVNGEALPQSREQYASRPHYQTFWLSRPMIIVYGQAISVLVIAGGATQTLLSRNCGVSSPALAVGLYYILLAQFLWTLPRWDVTDSHRILCFSLCAPPYVYAGIACLDVYASYFTVMALRYTTITSVTLLSAVAVPATMLLSYVVWKRRFGWQHGLGALVCLAGLWLNVSQDYKHEDDTHQQLRGDVLALIGGFLYGLNDVVGEVAVRSLGGPREYLGMIGLWGTVLSFFHYVGLERSSLHSDQCSFNSVSTYLVVFATISATGYVCGAYFLKVSEATFLNLSLQTGSIWSVFFVIGQRKAPPAQFFLAMALTIIGVTTYEMAPSPAELSIPVPVPSLDPDEVVNEDEEA